MKPLPFDEALALVLACASPLSPRRVPLSQSRGLRLMEDVHAPRAHPPRDDSAMDGYAVATADLRGAARGAPIVLPLAEEVCAPGLRSAPSLPPHQTMRILTGGPIPGGADAVVRQEMTGGGKGGGDGHNLITFRAEAAPGDNIRRAGEDLAAGALVLAGAQGAVLLGPPEITALAAMGVAMPLVVPRPRVLLLTTGDELCAPGETLAPGGIYDSNGAGLAAAIEDAGAILASTARAPDEPAAQRAALSSSFYADVIVTAGGISVGDKDHVAEVLAALGTQWQFRGVRMKPGHPFSFGIRPREDARAQLVFGLPGNPAAAQMAFELFVRPALRTMRGLAPSPAAARPAWLATPVEKRGGTTYFVRGRAQARGDGLTFTPSDRQGAGMITSMVGYDAVARLPAEKTSFATGELVEVAPRPGVPPAEREGPAVLAFVGPSGAGKTTLLEGVIRRLSARGVRVAVLKHAHHAFAVDPETKDTARLSRAGACSTAALSQDGVASVVDAKDSDYLRALLHGQGAAHEAALEAQLAQRFPAADLVVLEGFHDAPCRKIVVVDDRGPEPRDLTAKNVIASVGGTLPGTARTFSRDDLDGLADLLSP